VRAEWDEIAGIASDTFHFWTERFELQWLQEAWAALEEACLTTYNGVFEFYKVKVRLLILATLYCEFCYRAWREDFLDGSGSLQIWIGEFEFNSFVVGQMVGDEFESDDPEFELLLEGVRVLMRREREAVVKALFDNMGGENGVFVKLWTAGPGFREVENTPSEDVQWAILGDSGDGEKQEAYWWVSERMPAIY
jgi:hypothetical protein